ncbi:transposon Tf2-9 polyprotein [Trichonephila clavipes]|nr:transposon Tf2-9 polyprotein [Trichonephila clavipes]
MDPTKLSKNKMLLTGIGEAQVTTIGSLEHEFKIDDENYSLTWHVVPTDKLKFEAVIGSDLLEQASISFTKEGVKFNEYENHAQLMQISAESLQEELDLRHVENRQIKKELEKLIQDYKPEKSASTDVTMRIILKDEEPVCQHPRRLAFTERQEVNKQIEEWLNEGIIRPSSSEYASPIVMKRKPLCLYGTQQKEAFEKLKKITSEGPILHLYKYGRKTELHTDACKQEYGAILLQEAEDGMLHPVYYMSKKTNTAEEKYDSYELENTMQKKGANYCIARRALQLEEFDYEIEYRAGSRMKHVDALSRYPVMMCPRKLKQQQKTFGNPIRIISDRGSAFTSKLFNDYCDEENIQHLQIATGVPRGNEQVERIHRTLIPVLTKLSLDDSTKWYKYVDRLQRILNSTISRSTKWTPFELLVGIKMRNKEDIIIKDLLLEEMAKKELLEQREFLRNDAKRTSKPCSLKQ